MLCPSYPRDAARLEIGRRGDDGAVRFHTRPVAVRPLASVRVAQHGPADSGRYAGPCVATGCINWAGECRLGVRMADGSAGEPCAIAKECRWFAENGRAACGACQQVVYRKVL